MTIGLIHNWNEVVKPNDEVYILGDFAFQNSYMTPFLITDVLKNTGVFTYTVIHINQIVFLKLIDIMLDVCFMATNP